MKKTFAYALLVLTALYSCEEGKQEEPVLPGTTPDEIYLNVSPHTLTFDETDASKNIITVSTNTNWKATVDNSELKINRTEGTSEDTSISITEAPEGKTCKLTISTIPANGEKRFPKKCLYREPRLSSLPTGRLYITTISTKRSQSKTHTGLISTNSTAGKMRTEPVAEPRHTTK